jgi:hypothetical protein
MFKLPAYIRATASEFNSLSITALIHFSFFYKPSPMGAVLTKIRSLFPGLTRLIADVRDPLFTGSHVQALRRFDAIIGCSRRISEDLQALLGGVPQVSHIPIPFENKPAPDGTVVLETQVRYGLENKRYVLNPNGVTASKNYPALREGVRALRKPKGFGDVALVTCGRKRSWTVVDKHAEEQGLLRFIGPIPNEDVRALASGALLTAVIGGNEGLPRSALDVLSAGGRLMAPPLLEFLESIPKNVVGSLASEKLADQIQVLSELPPNFEYDLGQHDIERLISDYRGLETL